MSSQVYFIRAPSGAIKIGVSTDVRKRIAGLQTAHEDRLILIGSVPGGRALESEIHQKFAHLRRSGEWFDAAPDLISFIDGTLAAPQLPLEQQKAKRKGKNPKVVELSESLIAFLKEVHPQQTAQRVSQDTGINQYTVEVWLARRSGPNFLGLQSLIIAYGPRLLSRLLATLDPEAAHPWLDEAICLEDMDALIEQQKAALDVLQRAPAEMAILDAKMSAAKAAM